MSAREVLKTITEETPIPIIVHNDTSIFLLESYVCGYHVYMNIWNATINDYFQCKIEETTSSTHRQLPFCMMIVWKKKLLGKFLFTYQKYLIDFRNFLFCTISAVVIGKRVNRGAGDGLKIPVEYKFFGDARAVSWAENQIKKTEKNVNILVKKCMR